MRFYTVSVSDTEERIITVIRDHFLSGTKEKLTVGIVSERAGISRQAFHKNYLHLKGFITGQRTVDELLLRQGIDASKVILQTQKLVRELESELQDVLSRQDARFKEFENNIITSLMTSDILTHRAKELTAELRKKALHVEKLKRELDEKEVELSLIIANTGSHPQPVLGKKVDVHVFKPDLTIAVANLPSANDKESYIVLKRKAIDAMQQKVLRLLKKGAINVIIFQERYLCSFEKFIDRYCSKRDESLVVINLPIYSRIEIKEFIQALKGAVPLQLYVPYCDSEAVINAQRAFLFRNVPEFEFKAMAKEPLPTIYDGYDKVTVFRIVQGD